MRRLLLVLTLLTSGCAPSPAPATVPAAPPPPVVSAPPPLPMPAPAPTHALAHFGFWLDGGRETGAFTSFITVQVGCGDDAAYAAALADISRDSRRIVWFANVFSYGPTVRGHNGYALRPDASACWQQLRDLIASHADRTLAVWLLDEPDSVAFNDQSTDGYDPNLYNDIVNTACAMMHADFPSLAIGLNYGGAELNLTPPACLSIVGLETYGPDWKMSVLHLEHVTNASLWLVSPAYTDNGSTTDTSVAARLQEQYVYAQSDPRVSAIYGFLWCCDDITTGNKSFYAAGGAQLPATRSTAEAIGRAVRAQ